MRIIKILDKHRNLTYKILLATLITFFSLNAKAQTVSCSATTNFTFGSYSTISSIDKTSSSNISISCTNSATLSLQLSQGTSGIYTNRLLTNGVNKINYNLYADVGMNTVFGNGTNGTYQYSGSVGATPINVPVFGKIPKSQNVVPGTYTDNITIQITF